MLSEAQPVCYFHETSHVTIIQLAVTASTCHTPAPSVLIPLHAHNVNDAKSSAPTFDDELIGDPSLDVRPGYCMVYCIIL